VTGKAEAARAAAVAVLLAAAVIGLRARGTFSHQASSALASAGSRVITSVFGVAEGAGLVAFFLLLGLVLRRPRRHKPEDEAQQGWRPPVPWWAKPAAVLFALALLAAPWVILLAGRHRRTGTTPVAPPRLPAPRPGTGHLAAPSGGSPAWPLLAGVFLAVAAVLVLAVLARRRRYRGGGSRPARTAVAGRLAEGLAAGREALLAGGEPRAAIIACYAAMERGFAAAGSAPEAADTPAEVLARASEAGLVRSDSAEVLTGLFRRARYSSQPMTGADSGAAAGALARMRADLEGAGSGGGR
jgi:hypothetical protein